jgi:hypothetical protein
MSCCCWRRWMLDGAVVVRQPVASGRDGWLLLRLAGRRKPWLAGWLPRLAGWWLADWLTLVAGGWLESGCWLADTLTATGCWRAGRRLRSERASKAVAVGGDQHCLLGAWSACSAFIRCSGRAAESVAPRAPPGRPLLPCPVTLYYMLHVLLPCSASCFFAALLGSWLAGGACCSLEPGCWLLADPWTWTAGRAPARRHCVVPPGSSSALPTGHQQTARVTAFSWLPG